MLVALLSQILLTLGVVLPEDKRNTLREGLVRFLVAWQEEDWGQLEEASKFLIDVTGEVTEAYCHVTRSKTGSALRTLLIESVQQLASLGPLRTGVIGL